MVELASFVIIGFLLGGAVGCLISLMIIGLASVLIWFLIGGSIGALILLAFGWHVMTACAYMQ